MNSPATLSQLTQAMTLYQAGDAEGAKRIARSVLQGEPGNTDALHLMGMFELQLGRPLDAVQWASKALAAAPASHFGFNIRAAAYLALQRLDEAVADSEAALRLQPGFAEAQLTRACALLHLGRVDEAKTGLDAVIAVRPQSVDALAGRSNARRLSGDLIGAEADAEAAMRLAPGHADALFAMAGVCHAKQDFAAADALYVRGLSINPHHVEAAFQRIRLAATLSRHDEVIALYDRFLAQGIRFRSKAALHQVLHSCMHICDWKKLDVWRDELKDEIARGEPFYMSLLALGLFDDPAVVQRAMRQIHFTPPEESARPAPPASATRAIKVAYVSADFRDHPVARLVAGLFQEHDRTQCTPIGVSLLPDDGAGPSRRARSALDKVIDVTHQKDADVAALMREMGVDVAIDLMGHTANARVDIFAHRAAPVQVSFLGFPGPSGRSFIDYIIADKVVIPAGDEPFYDEQVCRLPDTFFPPDLEGVDLDGPSREDCNLPADGVVYAAFCNSWKILPQWFAAWMELLKETPGSVLWLRGQGKTMEANLRGAAERAGVDPSRLVFADRVEYSRHMARQRLADVMLDTFPYGAHTTAMDALRVGVPLVTMTGATFPSRVAASMLHACRTPELVTETPQAYKAVALRLGRDAKFREDIRAAIQERSKTAPLFDSTRYARHMERALRTMVDRAAQGRPPTSFDVPPIDQPSA